MNERLFVSAAPAGQPAFASAGSPSFSVRGSAANTVHSRWDELGPLIGNQSVRIMQKDATTVAGKVRSVSAGGIILRAQCR